MVSYVKHCFGAKYKLLRWAADVKEAELNLMTILKPVDTYIRHILLYLSQKKHAILNFQSREESTWPRSNSERERRMKVDENYEDYQDR